MTCKKKIIFHKLIMLLLTCLFLLPLCYQNVDAANKAKQAVIKGYPTEFQGIGPIDSINEKEAVIRDAYYKLSPDIKFHTPDKRNVTRNFFKVGNIVGFIKNDKNEIISMWLLNSY